MHDPLKDGISSVELIDSMGSDLTVVNAARVSMHKESEWGYGTDDPVEVCLKESDAKLIHYLATHGHWTPFSHPQISLRIKMPIFIARQWFKHQVGFTRNEVSRRYVDEKPELFAPTEWRGRAPNVKQGSSDSLVDIDAERFRRWMMYSVLIYEELLDKDVCPEQARMVLPQSMYTEFIETGSLAAYARLCRLRLDPHAQREVRQYAEVVSNIIEPLFPVSWKELMK